MPDAPGAGLLEPGFLRRLEQLSLVSRKVFAGQMKGERKSPRRGTSVEFADFRSYVPGDDLRYVDWNTYARLERMFLKLFVEEEDLHVYLLIDSSASMGFGSPSKIQYAQRAAAATGYIGLTRYDRVAAGFLREGAARVQRPTRGRGQVFPLFDFLSRIEAGGQARLDLALREFSLRTRQRGMVVLISDFLDPGWETGLKTIFGRGFGAVVLQVLDPAELKPDLVGDLKIIDSETGVEREVTISGSLLRDYELARSRLTASIAATCARFGADFLQVTSDQPFEETALKWMQSRRLVR